MDEPGRHGRSIVDDISLQGIISVRDRLLELAADGKKIMRLESGDPSFAIPPHVREAIERALASGKTHYTARAGIPELRQAAFQKLVSANRLPLSGPERVLVTNGAMHGLYITFRALVERPGDEIIVPDPTWTETADNVTVAGGTPVRCRLDPEQAYAYLPERIEALVSPRTRAIVVNSPHNPTGMVVARRTLEGILAIAERHGLTVVSDEAYEHVIFDGREHVSIGSLPGGERRVVSLFSLSKTYAMSGLRIGYLATGDDLLLERMTKLLSCTINGVNSASQHGAVAALTGPEDATRRMAAVYQARRDTLMAGLRQLRHLRPYQPQGAFYVWARIEDSWPGYQGRRDGWALTQYLIDAAGLGTAPGEVFGPAGAGHVRFAFSCATEDIEAAARVLPTLPL